MKTGVIKRFSAVAILTISLLPSIAQANMFGSSETKNSNIKNFTKWESVVERHNQELRSNSVDIQNWKEEIKTLKKSNKRDTLIAVNKHFNENISYRRDASIYGQSDYWATPLETAAKGLGDCDDYAIAKYFALKQLGFSENDMRLVVLKDKKKNEIHAVLAVREGSKYYILDNQIDSATPDYNIAHYEPIYSINTRSWWRHRG